MAYDLERFIKAQKYDYEQALSEIQNGRKRSHFMTECMNSVSGNKGFLYTQPENVVREPLCLQYS